jgi:hypothetical protein
LVDVPQKAQRHAQHLPDAESDRRRVDVRIVSFDQILDNAWLSGGEDLFRDSLTRFERLTGQGQASSGTSDREFKLAFGRCEHDETPIGAGYFNRCIKYKDQDILQHMRGAERAETFEERGGVSHDPDHRLSVGTFFRPSQEEQFNGGAPPKADAVALRQDVLALGFAVHERPVARPAIAQNVVATLSGNFGVFA